MWDSTTRAVSLLGCLGILAFNVTLGGWSVDYLLATFFNKNIYWLGDALIGLIAGEITVPVALIVWLLRLFGAI